MDKKGFLMGFNVFLCSLGDSRGFKRASVELEKFEGFRGYLRSLQSGDSRNPKMLQRVSRHFKAL